MINKSSNNFTTLPNDYENSSCIKCKYSKCPKYYAGYILYLKNKGLLETKLKDREEYRRNKFESDYFTFRWTVEDGVKKFQGKHLI